jgi:hypothetical protein
VEENRGEPSSLNMSCECGREEPQPLTNVADSLREATAAVASLFTAEGARKLALSSPLLDFKSGGARGIACRTFSCCSSFMPARESRSRVFASDRMLRSSTLTTPSWYRISANAAHAL